MKGIVVFAFALRDEADEPNPCNVRLGDATKRIVDSERGEVIIVSQWEVTRHLRALGLESHSVELRTDGSYLDSEGVWAEAEKIFRGAGITEVIPVAQPFLQMSKVRRMIAADGYTVARHRVGYVGFDKESTQPWTRGPLRLLLYALRQALWQSRGHNGKQAA